MWEYRTPHYDVQLGTSTQTSRCRYRCLYVARRQRVAASATMAPSREPGINHGAVRDKPVQIVFVFNLSQARDGSIFHSSALSVLSRRNTKRVCSPHGCCRAFYQPRCCPCLTLIRTYFPLPSHRLDHPGKGSPSRSGPRGDFLRGDPGSAFRAPPASGRRQGTPPRRLHLGGRAQCCESDECKQVQPYVVFSCLPSGVWDRRCRLPTYGY